MQLKFKLFIALFILIVSNQLSLAAAGDLDASFGAGGIVVTAISNSTLGEATGIVVQPDGKLIVSAFANGGSGFDIVLARYNPNGSLDTGFSGDGIVTTPFGNEFDSADAIALQSDGRILVAGRVGVSPARFAVVRYNSDGTPDATFDGDGMVTTTILQNAGAHAVALQADGKIIVAGDARNSSNEDFFTVVRYNPDGSIDATFGSSGMVFTSFGLIDFLNDLIVQNDGKILAVGTGDAGAQVPVLAMIRLHPDGSFDNTFNGSGRVAAQIPNFAEANSVDVQSDGKIIVGGQLGGSFSVFRFNPNGMLDATFDGDGVASADFNIFSAASDIKIQTDGKIVGVGETFGEGTDFAVARFNPNGSLDNTYGVGGKVVTAISGDDDRLNRLAIQTDGKIVGAGVSGLVGDKKITLARYLGNSAAPARVKFDYDADGKADLSVFRPSAASWYISNSSNNAFTGVQFGANGDLIAPADFDGDSKTDISVFRPSDGGWYRLNSSNNTFSAFQFGAAGDLPVPGDFDGDLKADICVYRPSAGSWYRINSSNNQFIAAQFGVAEDKPLVGDFDGDGKSDLAVFRPSNGTWYRINSATDTFSANQFGATGDLPVAADYDGDGKTDLAVYRPSVGDWYIINSSSNSLTAIHFGITEDKPAPADYDGDGKADLAVFRPSSGIWYLLRTTAGFTGIQFGANGDVPTPNAFVR
jgi:uncharacterized delta-60 repeat protein